MEFPLDLSEFIRGKVSNSSHEELFFAVCDEFADIYSNETIRETLIYEWLYHETS